VRSLQELAKNDALAERLRVAARRWVEDNFDAHKNASRLLSLFQEALGNQVAVDDAEIIRHEKSRAD
jgi:hypothetical protein